MYLLESKAMQQHIFSNFSQYGKSAIDSTKELAAINGRLMTKVLGNQIEFTNTVVGNSIKDVDTSVAKDPNAFIQYQRSLFEEYSEIFRSQAQTSTKVFQEAGEELKTWYEKSIQTAGSSAKKASKAAKSGVATAKKPMAKKATAKKAAPKKTAPAKATAKKPAAKTSAKKSAAA